MLYESLVLCEFFDEVYPDRAPGLLPADPYERARARIWINQISKIIVPAFLDLLRAQEPDKQREAREELYKLQGELSAQRKGTFFSGEQFSLVEIAIAPWIAKDYIAAEKRGYKREDVPDGWKEYADQIAKRDSVLKTCSVCIFASALSYYLVINFGLLRQDKERYYEIYQQFLDNRA